MDPCFSNAITLTEDGFVVEAELVAEHLGLTPDAFWLEMKRGFIYGVVERGEGDDAGRTRLTFRYRAKSWSITLEDAAVTSQKDNNPKVELSSPACSINEADDAYMGYAGKDELIAFLNELLEAERAGARVALKSERAAGQGPIAELMRTIQQDEARWCVMLLRHINAFGAPPSENVGAFYGKAMAIADLGERIAFLNRGQNWVARKLREMLPRVRDSRLHAELAEMLRSHEANITLIDDVAGRAP